MPRPRNPNRDKAYKLWEKSGRTLSPKDLGKKLGESPRTISKWKNEDKWEEKAVPKPGAPKGNKNALGNRGGKGAMERNTYGEKHGAYSKVYFDMLDEDEVQLLESIDFDSDMILRQEIQDMIIKARRLKRRIKAAEQERGGLSLDGVVRERTPQGEKTVTYTTSVFKRIAVLEAELDRTQLHITKAMDTLMRHRNEGRRLSIEEKRLELFKMKALGFIDIEPDDIIDADYIDEDDDDRGE